MKRIGPALLALTVAAAGCSSNSGSGSNGSTTSPSPTATVETFSGTVPVKGSDVHTFSQTQIGAVSATLTVAGPPSDITMGLGLGVTSGGGCALLPGASTTAQAGTTAQLTGTASAGTMCVQVFDIGNQTEPVNYTVSVSHL